MTLPIDTSMLTSGAEWNVGSIDGSTGAGAAGATAPSGGGAGFGSMLTDQLGKLEGVQNDAAKASQDLATGQATDPEAPPDGAAAPAPEPAEPSTEPTFHSAPEVSMLGSIGRVT